MNHFAYRDGELWCEDVPLRAIAVAVGTPVYVYSTATLERHLEVFKAAFAPREVAVAFAVKANGNIAVIATLARRGAGADTVSAGEIKRALAAGVAPSKIVFSGVGKTADELAFALASGVGQINVESAAELYLLEAQAAQLGVKPAVALRVNPAIGAGGHDKITTGGAETKFGVSRAEALSLYAYADASDHLDAIGLAVHIGSQIQDLTPLENAFRTLKSMARDLRAAGHKLTHLDLGGGLGVPYFDQPAPPSPAAYAEMINAMFADFEIALSFEPGRMIAANGGVLIAQVIRMQHRPERDILVLDAAMNDLIRPAMYDAFHDIWPVRESDATRAPMDVVGPVCETADTFARARALAPLAAGDLVAFMSAGAYGATMSSMYNARALAPEVLVRGDRFEIVRRRFAIEDQIALERLPGWINT
jgi:diaminopimelate decarboxylase